MKPLPKTKFKPKPKSKKLLKPQNTRESQQRIQNWKTPSKVMPTCHSRKGQKDLADIV